MDDLTPSAFALQYGYYSKCVEHKNFLYLLFAHLPMHPKSKHIPESEEQETQLVLHQMDSMLERFGACRNDIVQTRLSVSKAWLKDMVSTNYAAFIDGNKKAVSSIHVANLYFGCNLEMLVIARKKNNFSKIRRHLQSLLTRLMDASYRPHQKEQLHFVLNKRDN